MCSDENLETTLIGGRIDHGHHLAQATKALDETVQFSYAIKRAIELTSRDDTLIVITSDHAHTMSMSGYPDRGNPIIGLNSFMSDIGTINCFLSMIFIQFVFNYSL